MARYLSLTMCLSLLVFTAVANLFDPDSSAAYNLNITINGDSGGSVHTNPPGIISCTYSPQAGTCTTSQPAGTLVQLLAAPSAGSFFGGWSGSCALCYEPYCPITLDGDKNCSAIFTDIPPIMIDGNTPAYYSLFQSALLATPAGGRKTILSRDIPFTETLTVDSPVPVYIRGGFDETFSDQTDYSVINGTLTITSGPVIVDRIVIASAIPFVDMQPPAGNPSGHYTVPAQAGLEDVSSPDHVIGTGTPGSCTADAFMQAVAQGGKITFNCGPYPLTLTLTQPAKLFNNKPDVVIDGGGLVTLSGGGTTRILYMNTCDPNQVWTTDHCQDQDHPHFTVQNFTFVNANSQNEFQYDGGGAIWVRGGRLKIINSRFFNNVCASVGPDVGGAAIRVFDQYQDLPVYVVNSTFGGAEGYGNTGSNGGGISSIGVSWSIYNSMFSYNHAIGNGGNPAEPNTPGGGSGGAIYNDGNTMTLALYGTLIEYNEVNAYGSAIFFVTNDHTGTIHIEDSVIRYNIGGSWYELPGISMHSDTHREIINSIIE